MIDTLNSPPRFWRLFTVLFLLFTVSTVLANNNGEFQPERLVCRMLQGYSIDSVNTLYGTTTISIMFQTGSYLLATPAGVDAESLAAVIMAEPLVQYCAANYYLDAPEPFQRSSPFLDNQLIGDFDDQPAALTLALPTVHLVADGTAVKVAIIDTGLNFDHPEFAAKSGQFVSGYDFVDNDTYAFDEPGGIASGHGTFVAGAVSLVAPGAELWAYRVLDTLGRSDGYTLANAVVRAVDDGCKVVNLSLGLVGKHDALDDAIHYAIDQNVIVVAAVGNDSTGDPNLFPYPAKESNTIAVAALDSLNHKADFSNFGKKVDLCAPGTRVYAPYLDTSYAWWDGTSFAAPLVAGAAALLCQIDPNLTPAAVDSLLEESAINIDDFNPEFIDSLGKGLVNPQGALALLNNFICGDVDGSSTVSVSDAVYLINYVFAGGQPPTPWTAGDCDCTGLINISDAVYLIAYIFSSGNPPCGSCQ